MGTMSMNKAIHGAIRRDLERFVAALDGFPSGDQRRARQLATAWANFDDQLTHHHEGEHEIAWPALRSLGVSQDLLATLDAEHGRMAAALTKAREAMAALAGAPGSDQAQAARAAVAELNVVTRQHFDHEESEIEELYLTRRDAPEMKAMGRAFAKVGPARGGRFFAWLLDGASPEERDAVTSGVPGPVLAVIIGLFGRGYRKEIAPVWRT
jgi:hemerythrin-like domain-containing protein